MSYQVSKQLKNELRVLVLKMINEFIEQRMNQENWSKQDLARFNRINELYQKGKLSSDDLIDWIFTKMDDAIDDEVIETFEEWHSLTAQQKGKIK